MDAVPESQTTMQHYRASLSKRRDDVARMFDGVARRYDVTNDLMTVGIARAWRGQVVAAVEPRPGMRILDLAAGTGTSSAPFAEAGAMVAPTDLSLGMLRVGKQRLPQLPFVAGDALRLPYADDVFDVATISFGLRNVEDTVAALTELRRVTRPGGRLLVCEFSTPRHPLVRAGYRHGLLRALPAVARATASNPDAYVYLAESIRDWPDQQGLAALVAQAGWHDIAWQDLSGGIVALHRATA